MRLNDLRENPGATKARKRVGRGPGSGKGKTAGRGVKGQKSRSGVAIKGFEGGQMPIVRRLPKRGFNNIFAKDYNEVNLERIQAALEAGVLDKKAVVTEPSLLAAGIIRRARDGVRLLGKGEIKAKLSFEVSGASKGAVKAVEEAGGTVTLIPVLSGGEKAQEKRAKKSPAGAKSSANPTENKNKKKAKDKAKDKD